MTTTLSTHVLDIERGTPAQDVPITLFRGDNRIAEARTNADGRVPHLAHLEPGPYRIQFDVAAYFAIDGREAPFLQRVSIEFSVDPAVQHYHVPLLISPYACTSYRGS